MTQTSLGNMRIIILNIAVLAFILLAIWNHSWQMIVAVVVAFMAGLEMGSKTIIRIIKDIEKYEQTHSKGGSNKARQKQD